MAKYFFPAYKVFLPLLLWQKTIFMMSLMSGMWPVIDPNMEEPLESWLIKRSPMTQYSCLCNMCNARWNLSTRKLSPGQSVPRPVSPDVTSLSYVSPLLTPPQRIWLWHTPSSLLPLLSSSHRSPGIHHTHKTEITNNEKQEEWIS